mmetsp:Transcript_22777/g.34518  ORF Transcript_22777/g.34518 Transcript_22777/m.34518 type:complete len:552 (+) Transcript_22777:68-1723(+)
MMDDSNDYKNSSDSLSYREGERLAGDKETEPLKLKSLDLEITEKDHGGEMAYEPTLIDHEDTVLPRWLYLYLYPPKVPRECQMLRIENLAVPCCYLLVGILQGLQGPFTNVYPLDLGATEAQQMTVSTIRSIPASFKLLFGFTSDNFPILGYRRKSYMFIGWLMAGISMAILMAFSDLSSPKEEIPEGAPSMPFLSLCMLFFGTGFWLADVMGDSIVAEKAKLEIEKGHIQSMCYACRFFGLMTAAPLSTFMYSFIGPHSIVFLMSLLPLAILPTLWFLSEVRDAPVKPTKEQCGEIWNTVCSRAVWQPMGFVYLYNLLQVSNGAWKNFQKVVLGLTSDQLNMILNVAYVLLYVGVVAYKNFFINWSWRSVYIGTTLLNAIFSFLQILLIFDITFGLSYFWFSLGDDALAEFVGGIQFLPTTIMMVHLCPAGSEGASYAMFTTVNNSALNLSSAISTRLLAIWDVSLEVLQAGETSGMVNLTVLTTVLQLSGILFVGLLPRTKEDLAKLDESSSRSSTGGAIFLLITFCSVIYAITIAALNIVAPGWSGES